jgi:hypothetical protein
MTESVVPKVRYTKPQVALEWTPEMVELLLKNTAAGLSSREVVFVMHRELGVQITRNAIIGKLSRLKAKDPLCVIRPPVIKAIRILPNAPKVRASPKPPVKVANGTTKHVRMFNGPPIPASELPDNKFTPLSWSKPKSIMDLTMRDCRWPVGEDAYCCEPVISVPQKTSSYCKAHRQMAYYRP